MAPGRSSVGFASLPSELWGHVVGYLSVKEQALAAPACRAMRSAATKPSALRAELKAILTTAVMGRQCEKMPSENVPGAMWDIDGQGTRRLAIVPPGGRGLALGDEWMSGEVVMGPLRIVHFPLGVFRQDIRSGFQQRPSVVPAVPVPDAVLYLKHCSATMLYADL